MASPNDSGDDDDVGALIYRESQLRKAEAAAAAAESKKTSSAASSRNRTSARKRLPVNNQGEELSPSLLLCKGDSKRLHWRKVGLKKGGPKRSTTDMNALLMDVQTKSLKEEYA